MVGLLLGTAGIIGLARGTSRVKHVCSEILELLILNYPNAVNSYYLENRIKAKSNSIKSCLEILEKNKSIIKNEDNEFIISPILLDKLIISNHYVRDLIQTKQAL